jgi:UTP--glucose-1-phosphate uridylyltransferase
VGAEPFALLLGDDVFDDASPALDVLIKAHHATGKSVVGVQRVPMEDLSRYGVVNGCPPGGEDCWPVSTIVEKPSQDKAPSQYAVVGRYILAPRIFEALEGMEPGQGGEYQLTDALSWMAREGGLVAAVIHAKRYDTGDKLEYLKANVEFALKKKELAGPFMEYLEGLVAGKNLC